MSGECSSITQRDELYAWSCWNDADKLSPLTTNVANSEAESKSAIEEWDNLELPIVRKRLIRRKSMEDGSVSGKSKQKKRPTNAIQKQQQQEQQTNKQTQTDKIRLRFNVNTFANKRRSTKQSWNDAPKKKIKSTCARLLPFWFCAPTGSFKRYKKLRWFNLRKMFWEYYFFWRANSLVIKTQKNNR